MAKTTRMLSFLIASLLLLAVFGSVAAQESPTPTPTDTLPTATETRTGTASLEASETSTPEPSATPTPEGTSTAEPSPTATLEEPSITTEQLAETIFGGYGVSFTTNLGQAAEEIRFLAQDEDVRLLFTSHSFSLLLPPPMPPALAMAEQAPEGTPLPAFDPFEDVESSPPPPEESLIVEVQFVGASPEVTPVGQDPLNVLFGMYIGDDPSRWFDEIPLYEAIIYPDLYPGINLAFTYNDQAQIKSVFTLLPGADPGVIQLRYLGADSIAITEEGDLIVTTLAGEVRESAPIAFQLINDARVDVPVAFRVMGPDVSFSVSGPYDTSIPLVIDPILSYSTYFGGGGEDIATDIDFPDWCPYYLCDPDPILSFNEAWTAYVAGTSSSGGPTRPDAFVLRLRSEGKEVLTNAREIADFTSRERVALTYIQAPGEDRSRGMVVGPDGSAYVVGRSLVSGDYNFFVAKVASGGGVIYNKQFGGSAYEEAWDVAYDEQSNSLWVVGSTSSGDLPTIDPYQSQNGGSEYAPFDAFIARVDARDGSLQYLSYLGGDGGQFSRDEVARSVAVLDDGSFVLAGSTDSADFIEGAPSSYQADYGGGTDAFVARFTADGQDIVYWTYLGGPSGDHGLTVTVDDNGSALLGGTISSREIAGSDGVIQPAHAGGTYDGFLARFNREGPFELFSYLGGSGHQDAVNGVSTDITGAAYLAGYTSSDLTGDTLFPTTSDALQRYPLGGDIMDAFLTKVGPSLELLYSTYLGGQGYDSASKVTFWRGRTVLAGRTSSDDFPLRVPYQDTLDGSEDGFVARFGRSWTRSVYVKRPWPSAGLDLGLQYGRAGASGVVILDFGDPMWTSSTYGAGLWSGPYLPTLTSDPNDMDIDSLIRDFIRGWWLGYTVYGGGEITHDARLTVVAGTSNCCSSYFPPTPPEHAEAWAEMVADIDRFIQERQFSRIEIAAGLDAQLAWNDGAKTLAWMEAYFQWFEDRGMEPALLFDFGSCEGCHFALRADGSINPSWGERTPWTINQVWQKANGSPYTFPLPEIYTPSGSNALQWYVVSRYGQEYPPEDLRGRILFSGALTDCQSEPCPGPVGNPPDEGWWQLFEALYQDLKTRLSNITWTTDIDWLVNLVPTPTYVCQDC